MPINSEGREEIKIFFPDLEKKAQKLLGRNISIVRQMNGYSQKDLSISLGKSPNAISNWELGNTSPSIDDMLHICALYNISPNELLGWEDSPKLKEYRKQKEQLNAKMEELKKQKKEIEEQIKVISGKLDRK